MSHEIADQAEPQCAQRASFAESNQPLSGQRWLQSTVSMKPLTYSVPEVASLLRINRNTAYELVARGEIPSIRLGRRVLIVRARFDSWLAAPNQERER